MSLDGITIFMSGGSRGIGLAIAIECAKKGANIVIAAKTAEPHPQLPGTIYTAAEQIESAGGKCLPVVCDIRFEEQVKSAAEQAVKKFGKIDMLINNASAIWPRPVRDTPMKRYDLMNNINARGTYLCSRVLLPYLEESAKTNPGRQHILTISPPISMDRKWFKQMTAYTIAKYGMSMCCLGMSEEFKEDGIAVNCLWPRTGIATAAVSWIAGKESLNTCRTVDIMSEAAVVILETDSREVTGNFFIDDEVLAATGVTDFDKYAIKPGVPLMPDFFLEPLEPGQTIPKARL
eukprot:TRINITY_DN897_c5_g1_i1.p1 TRINITY_DN897_c5_g1~~TRINITY_DN897_c5_g1_i1.p1  ORF type:complete len:291 (+),score=131.26 TRINITY_DN897_c5_g1_i1:80-952(+)